MTFEPDGGGWNNIRMVSLSRLLSNHVCVHLVVKIRSQLDIGSLYEHSFQALETVIGLAIAMGRVLVMPPAQKMYLLQQGKDEQKIKFGFADFFPIKEIAEENDGLEIITMKEFLEAEAMKGTMRNKDTGKVSFPPGNQTEWEGQDIQILREWLRTVSHTPLWNPDVCKFLEPKLLFQFQFDPKTQLNPCIWSLTCYAGLAVFPASRNHKDTEALKSMHNQIHNQKPGSVYIDSPAPVDATPVERMRENLSARKELCLYDEAMQDEVFVHFMSAHKFHMRMLVHFYAFLFFEDWREVSVLCNRPSSV